MSTRLDIGQILKHPEGMAAKPPEPDIPDSLLEYFDADERTRFTRLEQDIIEAKESRSHGAVATMRKLQEEILLAAKSKASDAAADPEAMFTRLSEMAGELGYRLERVVHQ